MIRVYDILTKQILYINPFHVNYITYGGKDDGERETFEVYLTNNDYMCVFRPDFTAIKEVLDKCLQ